jgi:hypothetical protein
MEEVFGRSKRRWQDFIKICYEEMEWDCVEWIADWQGVRVGESCECVG